jgi:hypothetical protein
MVIALTNASYFARRKPIVGKMILSPFVVSSLVMSGKPIWMPVCNETSGLVFGLHNKNTEVQVSV